MADISKIKVSDTNYHLKDETARASIATKQDTLTSLNAGDNVTISQGGGHNLPSGYTELEYIESSGTQYIDTGIIPTINTRLEFVSKYNATNATQGQGCISGSGTYSRFHTYATTLKNSLYLGYTNSVSFETTIDTDKHTYIFDAKNAYVKFDDTKTDVTIGNMSLTDSYCIFARKMNNLVSVYCYQNLYSLKIWDNNSLIRDYVPSKRKSDNVLGLLDLVNNIFYENQGTGTFIAGPEVQSTTRINALSGLTSTIEELNVLDGITATTQELNYVDGVTSNIQTQLNSKVGSLADLGISATSTELNYTDGVTSPIQTQLDSKVEDLTDLGVSATASELNFVDGVTSAIQTQLDGKEISNNKVTSISSSSTNTQYPSALATYNAIEDIREVAEGKTKNYVCSDVTNPILNTQDATITLTGDLTDINGNTIAITDLKLGDNIYVIETDVPDRWYQGSNVLNKLETAKVPVSDVKVNGSSVITNNVADITVPTNNNQLTNGAGYITSSYHDATKYDASNPNGYTSNTGTVTSVSIDMNGATKGTVTSSGTIDLGTVLTEHQDISGKLNKSGGTMTGALTLTSQTSIWNTANIKDTKGSTIGFNTGGQIGFSAATDSSSLDNAFVFRVGTNTKLRIGNTNIRPETTNAYNCGTSSNQWNNLYAKTIYQNGTKVADLSGANFTGSLTVSNQPVARVSSFDSATGTLNLVG